MAFPIDASNRLEQCIPIPPIPPKPGIKEESIITNKVYDSCRAQDCISIVAYAAEPVVIDKKHIHIGDIIPVPKGSGSVDMSHLQLKRTIITSKIPSPFKTGFWDVEAEFVFEYMLTFHDCNNGIILCLKAFSTHKRKYHLFGSVGSDMAMATDFIPHTGDTFTSGGAPLAMVEAKAIALKSEFRCNHRDRIPVDVAVTIGIFSTMKLFRIVALKVQSRGFCIPRECEPDCPVDPCGYFDSLEFPMEIFAPPKREEYKK